MKSRPSWPSLLVALLIPQLAGGLGALATASSVNTWYRRLRKPSWTPPSWVFGPAWTTLYLLMGAASWIVWRKRQTEFPISQTAQQTDPALKLYAGQLALNTIWSLLFFGLRRLDLALVELGVLWTSVLMTIAQFAKIDRTAALLLVPYQAWITFAGALNAAVWWLNRADA
jgi:tryptophan-rich sensory protein